MIVTIGCRLAAAAGIATSLAAALPVRAQSLDDFYAKAKDEGAFAFYVGGPTAPWEARAKVFEERFPGIKVTIGGGFSNVLDKKIDAQLAAGKLEVDAAILQTAADYVRWKREGRLITFKPNGFDKMDAAFKDSGGTFWATMVNVVPYMYNTEKVGCRRHPERGDGFSKTAVPGQDRHRLSGGRRRHAVGILPHRAEIRLELHGQIHGRRSRASFRAISASSAASAPDRTWSPSTRSSTSPRD